MLVKYDAACRALAEAKSVDEVKGLRDKAEAMRAYAKQAKNRQLEVDAAEIRIRAERRLGEMIAGQKETVGLNKGGWAQKSCGASSEPQDAPPTLAEAGIDKKLSSRAQKIAAVPEQRFEGMLAEWRERVECENERVTTNLLREGEKAQRKDGYEAAISTGCTVADLSALIATGKKFGTIYADPPWLYDNQGTRAATGNHYSGLTVDELCALPIKELAFPDAHLHLWTTNGFLFDCQRIFEAWGFEFRSSFVWVKPQIGIGNYWRNSHEFLLTAIRGDAKRFNDKTLKSWLECDRGAHSAKPEQVRSYIERASPGPYLELFGRRTADNWTVWGNQIERSIFSHALESEAA